MIYALVSWGKKHLQFLSLICSGDGLTAEAVTWGCQIFFKEPRRQLAVEEVHPQELLKCHRGFLALLSKRLVRALYEGVFPMSPFPRMSWSSFHSRLSGVCVQWELRGGPQLEVGLCLSFPTHLCMRIFKKALVRAAEMQQQGRGEDVWRLWTQLCTSPLCVCGWVSRASY